MSRVSASVVVFAAAALCPPAMVAAQAVETARVSATAAADRVITLPGELLPFQATAVSARVNGFVDQVLVDRGSLVRQGQTLAVLSTPELVAQSAEALTRVQEAESRKAEADARLASAATTLERLTRAAATPGAVAGLDLERARDDTAAARALVDAQVQAVAVALAAHDAVRALEQFQRVTAPYSGRIVERLMHQGALAGPATGALFRIEDTSRLRLVVPVPEVSIGTVVTGRTIQFTVPSHPGQVFSAKIARSAGSLDQKTRTMTVEADVTNREGALAPGMFPDVSWPIVRARAGLLVPATAVVTTTERTFVIRITAGKAEWVTVKKGPATGDQVEVQGALAVGDVIVKRGSDEIRNGAAVAAAPAKQ
ncbi:MAG: efflux RND transporter periplasmic adaptor subunit [Acidobacteriota bacterium]